MLPLILRTSFQNSLGFLEINLLSKVSLFNVFLLFLQNFTARLNRAHVFIASKDQPERNRPLLGHTRKWCLASECRSLQAKSHPTIRFL